MANIPHPIVSAAAEFNPKEPFVGLYTMYYRQNTVGNHILAKNFRFHGSLKDARERAEQHCSIIGARLNWVQPLVCDLAKEEDAALGKPTAREIPLAAAEASK